MPGLKNERGSFMSAFKAYRLVTAADTTPQGVSELINAGSVKEAKGNQLVAQVVVPVTVTQYTIKVYGDAGDDLATPPSGYPVDNTRWALIDGLTARTESSFITIPNFPAVSNIKILITDVTGSLGSGAHILYSLTP